MRNIEQIYFLFSTDIKIKSSNLLLGHHFPTDVFTDSSPKNSRQPFSRVYVYTMFFLHYLSFSQCLPLNRVQSDCPRPRVGSPVLQRGKGESPERLWSPTWSLLGGAGASEPCRRWRCASRAMVTGEVRGLSGPGSDRTEFRFTKD